MWELLAVRKAFDRLWVHVRVSLPGFYCMLTPFSQLLKKKTFQAEFEKVNLAGVQ